jgi:hypothetical protein
MGIHIQLSYGAILRVPRVLTHIPLEISGNSEIVDHSLASKIYFWEYLEISGNSKS